MDVLNTLKRDIQGPYLGRVFKVELYLALWSLAGKIERLIDLDDYSRILAGRKSLFNGNWRA